MDTDRQGKERNIKDMEIFSMGGGEATSPGNMEALYVINIRWC